MGLKKYFSVLILLIVIITIQLSTLFSGTGYYLTQLTMVAYYSLVVIGLCMLMGYAGQMSLGHAGFFGIGGYISAVLTTYNLISFKDNMIMIFMEKCGILITSQDIFGDTLLNFNPWAAFLIAVFTAVIVAFAIGTPVLKLKGHYLAMATLGFGTIIYRVFLATEIFGEADGISEVPAFTLFPGITVSGSFDARIQNYYIAWVLVLGGTVILLNLIHSRVGRALSAIHGDEGAANAMGIDTARYKLFTFVLSAAFAAVAGVFLTHYNGGIGPSEAGSMKSIRYVAIVAIGGMANLWGVLVMGVILNFLSLRGLFGSYDDAVFGIILILIMLFAPEGVFRLNIWPKLKRTVKIF